MLKIYSFLVILNVCGAKEKYNKVHHDERMLQFLMELNMTPL